MSSSYIAVLCAYLEGDLRRIRASVLLGSVVPLLALLVWEAISLGLSSQTDHVSDPLELLMKSVNAQMNASLSKKLFIV